MAVHVFDPDNGAAPLPMIAKDARLVVWPGTGSDVANMNYVDMAPGEANVPHSHPDSEDTIFIVAGSGTVHDLHNDVRLEFHAGQAVHVPAGVMHAVYADRGERVISVGGPAPADLTMLGNLTLPST